MGKGIAGQVLEWKLLPMASPSQTFVEFVGFFFFLDNLFVHF